MQATKLPAKKLRSGKRKAPATRVPLTRAVITEAALDLIDRDGMEALSFRRLGAALGCEAMSLYHYFPSKAHLLDALVDHCFGKAYIPPPDLPWVEQLRQAAHGYRAMARKYPKLYPLLAVHRLNTKVGITYLDRILGIYRAAGFDDRTAAHLFRETGYYLTGALLDETAGYAKGPSAAEPVSAADIATQHPNIAAAAPFFNEAHFDSIFTTGLEMLLAGFQRIERRPG